MHAVVSSTTRYTSYNASLPAKYKVYTIKFTACDLRWHLRNRYFILEVEYLLGIDKKLEGSWLESGISIASEMPYYSASMLWHRWICLHTDVGSTYISCRPTNGAVRYKLGCA